MKQSEIKSQLKQLQIQPSAEMLDTTRADMLAAQEKQRTKRAVSRPIVWRFIMESKVTRYSSAAVVAMALGLVLVNPFGGTKNGGVVWADVAEKVGEMRTLVHKERRIVWEIGKEDDQQAGDVVRYVSSEYGIAEEQYDDQGTLMFRAYLLKESQQFIIVFPAAKKYLEVPLSGELFDKLTGMLSPSGLVAYYTSGQYTELGRSTYDDIEAEGFEITDPDILFPISEPLRSMVPAKDLVGRIWIDAETSLPIGSEIQFDTGRGLLTGFKKLHCEFKSYDLQWNVEIPEEIFNPSIPDDFTEVTITDFIPTEVKAGLVGMGIIPVGIFVWRKRRRKNLAVQSN